MLRRSLASLTLASMALLNGAPSWAGGGGQFAVHITLSSLSVPVSAPVGLGAPVATTASLQLLPPSGLCRSRTLVETDGASVEVACQSGQFVSIAPDPRASLLGLRDDAFRYSLAFRTELSLWKAARTKGDAPRLGWGTVTALRLYDLAPPAGWGDDGWDRPLDMLVTF
jgi:hypothetical protein